MERMTSHSDTKPSHGHTPHVFLPRTFAPNPNHTEKEWEEGGMAFPAPRCVFEWHVFTDRANSEKGMGEMNLDDWEERQMNEEIGNC
jgi:hypothetical protein